MTHCNVDSNRNSVQPSLSAMVEAIRQAASQQSTYSTQSFVEYERFKLQRTDEPSEIWEYQSETKSWRCRNSRKKAHSFSHIKNVMAPRLDPEGQEKLARWEKRVGKEEAERIKWERVRQGKLAHQIFDRGLDPTMIYEAGDLPYIEGAQKARQFFPEVITAEQPFINSRLQLLVKPDRLVLDPDGFLVLLSYKTRPEPLATEFLGDRLLQLAAEYLVLRGSYLGSFFNADGRVAELITSLGNGENQRFSLTEAQLKPHIVRWAEWLKAFRQDNTGAA